MNKHTRNLDEKHLSLRLPSAPSFVGNQNESIALTKLRAMHELMTGKRITIHALLMQVIDTSTSQNIVLPVPKTDAIPKGASFERIDVRIGQQELDILDALRDQLKPRPGILDIREHYGRVDVLRELLRVEHARVEKLFMRWMGKCAAMHNAKS